MSLEIRVYDTLMQSELPSNRQSKATVTAIDHTLPQLESIGYHHLRFFVDRDEAEVFADLVTKELAEGHSLDRAHATAVRKHYSI